MLTASFFLIFQSQSSLRLGLPAKVLLLPLRGVRVPTKVQTRLVLSLSLPVFPLSRSQSSAFSNRKIAGQTHDLVLPHRDPQTAGHCCQVSMLCVASLRILPPAEHVELTQTTKEEEQKLHTDTWRA